MLVKRSVNNYVHRMTKRTYKMRKRAQSQEETRSRIVEATMALHEELGPRQASIKAIAERAGVQRLTVYRHFPDDVALFRACTSHWLELNPPPMPEMWGEISDGRARCRAALGALYAYYRRTRRMWTVSYRDLDEVPALHGPMAEFEGYLAAIRDDLVAHLAPGESIEAAVTATVGHALRFSTWRSLDEQGLDDAEMVALVLAWLAGAELAPAREETQARRVPDPRSSGVEA